MNSRVSGFALPTVLIAGLVSMMVLMVALTASSGVRSSLDDQYYQQLAREAAESGVNYASYCMSTNGYIASWSGRTLDTGDSCNGQTQAGVDQNILSNDTIQTRFVVADMPATTNQQIVDVVGYTELKRSTNGSVWKTYQHHSRARVSSEVGASRIAFGYVCCTPGQIGAYFASITSDGKVKSTGYNGFGQLGNGTVNNSLTPQTFQLPDGVFARDIKTAFVATGRAVYVITSEGEVYAAGTNEYGSLGVGSLDPQVPTPQKMVFSPALAADERVVNVDNNSWATYAITNLGNIYSAGSCNNGVAGRGAGCTESNVMRRLTLSHGGVDYKASATIATDRMTVFVITTDGKLFGWGENLTNSLGTIVPENSPLPAPTRVHTFGDTAATGVKSVATDARTVYVITENGLLYARGDNFDRQISPSTANIIYPNFVQVPQTTHCPSQTTGSVVDVRTDRSHALVLYANGNVCSMGYNRSGELGQGSISNSLALDRVQGLPAGFKARAIAVSSNYSGYGYTTNNSFVVGEDGTVYGAGSNNFYQLGIGGTSTSAESTFRRMLVFGPANPAGDVKTGLGTTVVTTRGGRFYAVGNNDNGQLGNGTTTRSSTPSANKFLNVGPPFYF